MKKRKSHRLAPRFLVEDKYSPSTYLRLCHRCLFLNEGSKYIEKCSRCESQFAEFSSTGKSDYKKIDFEHEEDPIHEAITDFDTDPISSEEGSVSVDSEEHDDDSDEEEKEQKKRAYPISGLSVLW